MGFLPLIKKYLGILLLPVARAYIRFSPIRFGKEKLYYKFYWRKKKYAITTKEGFKMVGHSNDFVQGYIYYFGIWEPNLTAFIKSTLIEPDRTFIDIGANVGYFTLLASQLLYKGNVVSVEAFPSIFDKLKHNVAINKCNNVRMLNIAASDEEKEIYMYHRIFNEGGTTSKFDVDDFGYDETPTLVKAKPLYELLESHEVQKVRLIKIDVEGAEYEVLRGLYPLLSSFPDDTQIIVEISPKVSEFQQKEMFDTFKQHGFMTYKITNIYMPDYYINFHTPEAPELLKELPQDQVDVIFSRKAIGSTHNV
jgi:FkbM family methyltransferase